MDEWKLSAIIDNIGMNIPYGYLSRPMIRYKGLIVFTFYTMSLLPPTKP